MIAPSYVRTGLGERSLRMCFFSPPNPCDESIMIPVVREKGSSLWFSCPSDFGFARQKLFRARMALPCALRSALTLSSAVGCGPQPGPSEHLHPLPSCPVLPCFLFWGRVLLFSKLTKKGCPFFPVEVLWASELSPWRMARSQSRGQEPIPPMRWPRCNFAGAPSEGRVAKPSKGHRFDPAVCVVERSWVQGQESFHYPESLTPSQNRYIAFLLWL